MKLETYLSALRKAERMRQIAIWFNESGLIAKRVRQADKFAARILKIADTEYDKGYYDGLQEGEPDYFRGFGETL